MLKYTPLREGSAKKLCWQRSLIVSFGSEKTKRKIVFDGTLDNSLAIEVDGYKYMSVLKDSCTIRIHNLTYREIIQLISGEYYDVEIYCGYKNSNVFKIFDGGVIYISQELGDRKTTTAIILCGSKAIAKFSKNRLKLSLNSGINLYSALKFVCKMAEIPNSNISDSFKTKFIQNSISINSTATSWIESITNSNENFISNSDSSQGSFINIYDASRISSKKIIRIDEKTINLSGGYPRAETTGISLTLMPSREFAPGDIIYIDPSLIDISTSSREQVNQNTGYYLPANGLYIIKEIHYQLQNKGSQFNIEISGIVSSILDRFKI